MNETDSKSAMKVQPHFRKELGENPKAVGIVWDPRKIYQEESFLMNYLSKLVSETRQTPFAV